MTLKYGGNSACIEIRVGKEERLVIVDAGAGIRQLGNYLMQDDLPKGPIRTDPDRTDRQIDVMAEIRCRSGKYGDTEIFFAREGMEELIQVRPFWPEGIRRGSISV
jgi:hypothetical protein